MKFSFSQNHIFAYFFFCVACFYWKEIKYLKNGMWQSRQLNFLQNDARFSLLGQKLWEEIFLVAKSVIFQEGRKTSKYNKMNYVPNIINNNINCWYVVLILLHWWNNKKKLKNDSAKKNDWKKKWKNDSAPLPSQENFKYPS